MNTRSEMNSERVLSGYSVDIDQWWDGAGDTDQTLGAREWLAEFAGELTDEQRARLSAADEKAIAMAARFSVAGSFDVLMLKKIAEIARRSGPAFKRAA